MTRQRCETVQDQLPDVVRGDLSPDAMNEVRSHLAECTACAATLETVELLAARPPARPPAGFEARMRAAAREALRAEHEVSPTPVPSAARGPAPGRGTPSWALAAAAGVILALGTPLLVQRMNTGVLDRGGGAPATGAEVAGAVAELLPSTYVSEDPVVAGAPVLDGLSDEALMALLREMGG
jgi:anti-sigma factor RsiW